MQRRALLDVSASPLAVSAGSAKPGRGVAKSRPRDWRAAPPIRKPPLNTTHREPREGAVAM
ncbi:MAG: hypothetical protein KDB86_03535 [Actinobacteria bacterium]|nr:hypothetical protein [Actinomycetota bacterium]